MRTFLAPPPDPSFVGAAASAPTFSVVIPAYQAGGFVAEAVESALTQTTPPHEVIVCDDGSSDDLDVALAPFANRILFLQKAHGGSASARNYAARVARGEFLALLDADDVYHPRRLEALGELSAARPDLDILATDAFCERDGDVVGRFSSTTPFEIDDQRAGILQSCFVGGWPAVRRRSILAVGGWDETLAIAHDWDLSLRLILGGSRAGFIDEPLMSYRPNPRGLTADRIKSLQERVLLLERAQRHPSLTQRERRIVRASARWQRARIGQEAAQRMTPGRRSAQLRLTAARARQYAAYAWLASVRRTMIPRRVARSGAGRL